VFGRRAAVAEQVLIDGIVVAPPGWLVIALTLTLGEDRISEYTVIADPARLAGLWIALLDYPFGR
jgi:RNA polymerase sigma-70 factor (ECF subfamily)